MSSFTVTDNGYGDDVLTITSISAAPSDPKPGRGELQVTVQGTTSQDITDGAYIEVTVKLGLIKLLQKRFDLFAELRADSTTVGSSDGSILNVAQQKDSVIPAGDFTLTYTLKMPREIPRAKFTISASFWNADDADIATLVGKLDLLSNAF